MILIGLGSNLDGPWGSPRETVAQALQALGRDGLRLVSASRPVVTLPLGPPNQPHYVNAVARIETHLPPEALMRRLHAIEHAAGRKRRRRWGPRTLDLDLLDYHGLVRRGSPILPHPGIAGRDFVLSPIAEIAPGWRHPVERKTARALRLRLTGVAGSIIAS
ncbi:2-amino-4-hydroxy-6-hydroxymethyldihydropteridinediphosphokinase [soil metagenome]